MDVITYTYFDGEGIDYQYLSFIHVYYTLSMFCFGIVPLKWIYSERVFLY